MRPRSVGELAELTGARQPQTTKHLQTLARAGLVTVHPLGQRRVYAVETAPLAALARGVETLLETAARTKPSGTSSRATRPPSKGTPRLRTAVSFPSNASSPRPRTSSGGTGPTRTCWRPGGRRRR
ncbi:helix-turn-helix domain-containing protein [Amycolatopsis sp. NBC_00355]|uniref:ArsR/SmtB family transcription factor n=1 Tax=Amycolatopsis sp. NBC_00355 TaxID=2975957 RepID=UPI002E259582